MQAAGEEVVIFSQMDWSVAKLYKYALELRALDADVYLIQYPTEGYGYSLVPQLLAFSLIGKQCFVTLHEYSRKSRKGKLAIYMFFLSSCKFIYTNQLDAEFAVRWAPWKSNSRIIPIGSNIPWREADSPEFDLSYFGLIRPHKGIEEFLEKASSFKKEMLNAKVAFIGDVPRGYEDYAQIILDRARSEGFEVNVGLDMHKVSNVLSKTKICFFPFAEGLSERRGSVLAALGNGSLVVGTGFEPNVSVEFKQAVVITSQDYDLHRIYEMNEIDAYRGIKDSAQAYCLSRSWNHIAEKYRSTFQRGLV
jgi:glycosyltransferase involved in cell wall biosynthesis